jgi:hypothetical protein
MEGWHVVDRVVRRSHQHQRGGIALDKAERGDAHGRGSVAAHQLKEQRLRRCVDLAQLFSDEETILLVGDNQRRGKSGVCRNPQRGLLQQAVVADQRQEFASDKV